MTENSERAPYLDVLGFNRITPQVRDIMFADLEFLGAEAMEEDYGELLAQDSVVDGFLYEWAAKIADNDMLDYDSTDWEDLRDAFVSGGEVVYMALKIHADLSNIPFPKATKFDIENYLYALTRSSGTNRRNVTGAYTLELTKKESYSEDKHLVDVLEQLEPELARPKFIPHFFSGAGLIRGFLKHKHETSTLETQFRQTPVLSKRARRKLLKRKQ